MVHLAVMLLPEPGCASGRIRKLAFILHDAPACLIVAGSVGGLRRYDTALQLGSDRFRDQTPHPDCWAAAIFAEVKGEVIFRMCFRL